MNKRFKQLALQADEYCRDYVPNWNMNDYNQKFAESIVRECVQVCADRGAHHDGLYSAWADDCSKRIGKHFGVNE